MTRKHFDAIALALRYSSASKATVQAVASTLGKFNPAFDYTRFMIACGW